MAKRFEEIVDLYFTQDGDFVLGENGDLQDTNLEAYRGFVQRVLTRMMSRRGDWSLHTDIGANLTSFVGLPNTEEIGSRIKDRVSSELYQENLLRGSELTVEVVPYANTAIAIILVIRPPRTAGQIVLSFTYDMRENKLIPRNL